MIDYTHYVPTLKWRQGEYRALQGLSADVKSKTLPLIEIPPPNWDYDADQRAETVENQLLDVPQQMKTAWGTDQPVFVDLAPGVGRDERMLDGQHPVAWLGEQLSAQEIKVVPVVGISTDGAGLAAAKQVCELSECGACIRLNQDAFDCDLDEALPWLTQGLKTAYEETDLVIDLGSVNGLAEATVRNTARSAITTVPAIDRWRSVTVLSGAFPIDLSAIAPGTGLLNRTDWLAWRSLLLQSKRLPRRPVFGDYGVQHPEPREIDPRVVRMSANIRYTSERDWVIFRGRDVRNSAYGGYSQYIGLSQQIVSSGVYSGAAFSWGDAFIQDCATAGERTGNASKWRQVGTSHHITFAVRQVANLFGISASA